MSVDTATVNRLLQQSREKHTAKKRAAGVVDRDGRVVSAPNYQRGEAEIVEALRLRLEAHELDPEHTAEGWRDDRAFASDEKLIAFYVAYSKPLIPEEQMALVLQRFPAYAEIRYIP